MTVDRVNRGRFQGEANLTRHAVTSLQPIIINKGKSSLADIARLKRVRSCQ